MKHAIETSIITVLFVGSLFLSNATAAGLGFALSSGGGSSDWDVVDWVFDTTVEEFSTDDSRDTFALVFDTTVAKNRLFNYRLSIGHENYDADRGGDTFEMDGWFMSHDFGFGIKRTENVRIWFGPQLRISHVDGDTYHTFAFSGSDPGKVEDLLTVGIGPVLGINMNLPNSLTFTITAGILAMSSVGNLEVMRLWGPDDYDLEVRGEHAFVTAGLIFRLGDEYKK